MRKIPSPFAVSAASFAISLAAVAFVCAEAPGDEAPTPAYSQKLSPGFRKATIVNESERNPFSAKARPVRPAMVDAGDSEEARIRAFLTNLPVGGVAEADGSVSLLLGSLRVQNGQDLPPLFPGQTEKVRLVSATSDMLVFGFVEKDGQVGSRTVARSISLRPRVRHMLPIQSPPRGGSPPAAQFGGVVSP